MRLFICVSKKKKYVPQELSVACRKIDRAFNRKARKMRGEGHERNKAWRIAQAERDMTLPDDQNW